MDLLTTGSFGDKPFYDAIAKTVTTMGEVMSKCVMCKAMLGTDPAVDFFTVIVQHRIRRACPECFHVHNLKWYNHGGEMQEGGSGDVYVLVTLLGQAELKFFQYSGVDDEGVYRVFAIGDPNKAGVYPIFTFRDNKLKTVGVRGFDP